MRRFVLILWLFVSVNIMAMGQTSRPRTYLPITGSLPTGACNPVIDVAIRVRVNAGTLEYKHCKASTSQWTDGEPTIDPGITDPGSNGILVRSGIGTAIVRALAGTTNEIVVTNGDGVSGNPTISISSTFDISGKTSTKPIKTGTTAPATCTIGEFFFDTDATAGQNTYACTATNTWTLQGGTGGGISGAVTNNLIKAASATTGTDSGIATTMAANSISSRYNVVDYASFSVAVSTIGATPATLVIPVSQSVSASVTVPSTLNLEFTNSGELSVSAGQTVTINGSINAPLKRIFTGSGAVIFGTTSKATAYVEWFGALCNGSANDSASINAAITAITAGGLSTKGGEVLLPPGICRANISIVQAKGIRIASRASRLGTTVRGIGSSPALNANGLWYSQIEGIFFDSESALSGMGIVEIDGNYDGSHTQGVQGNTFKDCYFSGAGISSGGLSTYAFTMMRRGQSSGQGSENLFLNCHFSNASTAAYYQIGFNALNNTFVGGNFQSYSKHGIQIVAGSIQIYSVGFQSTYEYTQILNDGYDIDASSAGTGEPIIVSGCRTESLRFYRGGTSQKGIIHGVIQNIASQTWTANNAFSLNQIVFKSTSGGSRLFRVTTAGTSGGSEPTWPPSGTVADGSVVWTQTSFTGVELPNGEYSFRHNTINGTLNVRPPQYLTVRDVATDYTSVNSDSFLLVDSTSGPRVINLTAPPSYTTLHGQIMVVKRYSTSANAVSILNIQNGSCATTTVTLGGGTLDGAIFVYGATGVVCAGWYLVSRFTAVPAINATDTIIPYRSSSGAFSDSQLIRLNSTVTEARSGTNSQTFNLYNTADAGAATPTNYERLGIKYTGNVITFASEAGGTGTARNFNFSGGTFFVTPSPRTTGSADYFRLITPADTTLTASAEAMGGQFGGDASGATVTRQFATGALTTNREFTFIHPTYGFVGASTLTNAATVAITGAPVAGTNATITNPLAFWVQAGESSLAGNLGIGVTNPALRLDIADSTANALIRMQNNDATGYVALDLYNSSGTAKAGIGVGNASAASPLAGNLYFSALNGSEIVMLTGAAGTGTERARVNGAGIALAAVAFANLSSVAGQVSICSDCVVTSGADNTCASGVGFALVVRLNSVNRCFALQN